MSGMALLEIFVRFNDVSGYFACSNNKLLDLEGCPISVGGNLIVAFIVLIILS